MKKIYTIILFLGLSQTIMAAELMPSQMVRALVKEEVSIMTNTAEPAKDFRLSVDGKYKIISDPVLTHNGRIFLPVRALGEILGIEVDYLPAHRLVVASRDATYLELPLGYNQAVKNKTDILPIDKSNPEIRIFTDQGRTYLPLRFIAENLGIKLLYKDNVIAMTTTGAEPVIIESPPYLSKIKANESILATGGFYLNGWGDRVSPLQTIVNSDGSISVLNTTVNNGSVSIYDYNKNAKHLKTIKIKADFPMVGAFTKDANGHYYVVFGKNVAEGAFNDHSMALVKYDAAGKEIDRFNLQAQTSDERWAPGYSGVMDPFGGGSCRLEISGDKISAYFARQMFKARDGLNHQASYGFTLNKDNFKVLSGKGSGLQMMPSAGHSFNQFILPVEEGFVYVDHGDVGPRAFAFEKVTSGGNGQINSFEFKKAQVYQNTFADLGGLSKTPSGYIFAGTYENTTDLGTNSVNGSRNLFLLTLDKKLSQVSDPIYITSYTDKDNQTAVHPKIVEINDNKHLLLWEKYNPKTGALVAYMGIIDGSGKLLGAIKELPNTILNANDIIRYNPKTGFVHWAVSQGSDTIALYSLDMDE